MMATARPPCSSSFLPLLESLEDGAAGHSEHTDAYLTIANRLSGDEGRQFLPAVEKHFSRLGKAILAHITNSNTELSQAALQALGFCVYHSHVVSGVPEAFSAEILSALCSLVVKSTDKNTCTRALWVISKQSFPPDVVAKKLSPILATLESVWSREDIQSVVMEHEALNVIIRMLEQVPAQMGVAAVRWGKLVVPLVVHSASKVRLRAAAAMEIGMPMLLEKQTEMAAIIEPMMSTKLIPELQKLFTSKNETNVLKLWPLFVKLLGKMLHKGGPFINSLLHLEELGFRSSSPTVKKIAFIAWKSLIDNFAINPDILCSAKRMKLLMQPLMSIHVRTEALMLTKVEVWWYLVVQLGPNLSSNFDQVSVPLLQCTIGCESSSVPGTPSRAITQNGAVTPGTPKTGIPGFNSSANTPRMSLNSSVNLSTTYPSIQLLGLEMILHYLLGPEAVAAAAKRKLTLTLEPLKHPLISGTSSFTKHAAVLISNIRDGFNSIGKDAPDSLLAVTWMSLVRFVNLTIESGSKKDRQGCEVLTLMLQALQSIITSETLPADRVLILVEATVKGIPQRVLGSASYQVGKMDVLNGTPALFLTLLLYNSSMLSSYIEDERFFQCFQTLVGCGLSGHTSPLAFVEAVLGAVGGSAGSLQSKEHLWRMWSVIVAPLTDTITQSNEVNQGDALEHNFNAMHSTLLFPVTHLLRGMPLQQTAQKSMLSAWSKLYKVFARCSALVVTAEENICCEELCAKVAASVDRDALKVPSTLNVVTNILQVMVECVDFSPYSPQFQQKLKSPHTPGNWMRKRNKALGNLSTFLSLLVQCLEVYLEGPKASSESTGVAQLAIMSALFTNLVLANAVQEALSSLVPPLSRFYSDAASEPPEFTSQVLAKLERLLGEVLVCVQSRSTLAFNDELLALLSPLLCVLFPHKNKQLRTSVTQFWNSTFAKSVGLTYPAELRPILSQVKQKTPIILPGFEIVTVSDELSGQYSSESSQLETKLSGIPISSVGKRDSLLGKATELKDRSSIKTSKPVSMKLDFSSPKPPRRDVLEEEASIDFVFIPPETKERVLTEHQKEVKRTKRVDIPAMYNNLDASLDTTVFTQYTQSQDDSMDKLPAEKADMIIKEAPGKVLQEDMQKEDKILTKETQDYTSPTEADDKDENQQEEEIITECANVLTEGDAKSSDRPENTDILLTEGPCSNITGSSDLVSGTPQKPNSRRQSFITLEKYAEGKPASPSSASMFTGRLIKTPNSQEHSETKPTPPDQDSQSTETKAKLQSSVNSATESPLKPKDAGINIEPVKLTERLPSDTTDEDVIPDTQDEVQDKDSTKTISSSEDTQPSSQEEELDDSQSSMSQTSPDEPRRSGRQKIRPVLPGEDPEERGKKHLVKRRRSGQEPKGDSPNSSSVQGRVTRRSLQVAEEEGSTERLRTRAQKEKSETRQTISQGRARKKIKLYSSSDDTLNKHEPTRRSTRERESSQTDLQSDSESLSQGRRGRRSKASREADEEGSVKKKGKDERQQSSQTSSQEHVLVKQIEKNDNKLKDSQGVTSPPQTGDRLQQFESVDMIPHSLKTDGQSQEFEVIEQMEDGCDKPEIYADIVTSSQTAGQSQEFEPVENIKKEKEHSLVASPLTNENSQDGPNTTKQFEDKSEVKHKTRGVNDDSFSQEDSEVITPSSSDSQGRRRSRRSKASSEAAEVDDKHSLGRQTRSNSKTAVSVIDQAEASIRGRTRRSKGHEEFSKSSPSSTPESSQSLDIPEKSSQGRGKYLRRRSSQGSVATLDSPESQLSDVVERSSITKKRGRKPRASLPSPLTLDSKEVTMNDLAQDDADSQELDTQCFEADRVTEETVEKAQNNQDVQDSETFKVTIDTEERPKEDSSIEAEVSDVVPLEPVASVATEIASPSDNAHMDSGTKTDNASSREGDTGDTLVAEPIEISEEPIEEPLLRGPTDAAVPHNQGTEEPQVSEPSDEKADRVSETEDGLDENQKAESERLVLPVESTTEPNITDVLSEEDEKSSSNQLPKEQTPLLEDDNTSKTQLVECQDEEQTQNTKSENDPVLHLGAALGDLSDAPMSTNSPSKDVCQDSPVKQKDLEAVMGSDVGQSPCSGRTRGTWSPSASPSTSILKKCQKRPLEEDTPSPLVKSRRVSFANPIQQQETADDIDRRSPAIRTSSPRRSKVTGIPQPKYITTPTKGLLILSPRNLRSPGSKSSKKCLISEMSQEQRPVPRDCIYPGLIGCSTPVEAVLPQISSNMWSRGFGQLVRARNIKTVGDLSALTPTEIKTLPIRSPKISNVKKALRIYEQQRKGRGGDELKSLDEMEMMTSELEESSAPQNQDEEEKTAGETLATELVDEPHQHDGMSNQDVSGDQTPDTLTEEQHQQPPEDPQLHPDGLTSDLQALSCRMTPLELSRCSPQQLVQIHDQLGGMMRRVVVELQSRLYQTDSKT